MRHKDSAPRTVLITGATSGLGLELAKLFLAKGDHVIVTDVHAEAPRNVAALDGDWVYRKLDVTSDDDWRAAADAVDELDILVSNAGIAIGGRITKTTIETWQRALDINVLGSVRGARAFVAKLNDGGQIVLTASLAGLVHAPGMATYNTTKAAMVALGETLDAELRHRGISTTVVCPQFFKSGLADSLVGDDDAMDATARKLLNGTWLTSEVIAQRALKGIEARRTVVTPDAFALFAWYSKRYARLPFLLTLRAMGRTMAKRVSAREAGNADRS
ncbi:SDR family NAD(P)-dependent oxidoreductase [Corynebacterium sp. H113]|uniref:SDR family NAD(P)-dependent oxidoreductase n=1 Tax=Corynebacterium sp. H113 TaxID=3133419 RepID=UPI0030A0E1B4